MALPLDIFDEDDTYDHALHALQERKQLGREVYEGEMIETDLAEKGPLYQYTVDQRDTAIAAIVMLINADPKDVVTVIKAQSCVREYLRVAGWARGVIEKAKQAKTTINEVYDDVGEQPED